MTANTYLAFDYGIRRMGVAVGQTVSRSATALSILLVKNGRPHSEQLDRLVEDWQPAGFVLGLPAEPETQGPINIAKRVRSFASYLTRRYHKPCFFIDERLSSRVIKDKEKKYDREHGREYGKEYGEKYGKEYGKEHGKEYGEKYKRRGGYGKEYRGHRGYGEHREHRGHKGHIDSLVAQALLNDWLADSFQKQPPASPAALDQTL